VTKGVIKAQAIQFWYGILTQPTQPTLALVFQVSKCIEFNMVEEKVITLGFSRETLKLSLTSSMQ
jgi:hypothetical protein